MKSSDPDLYRELSEPFENEDELQNALDVFFEGLSKLREECGLPDIFVAAEARVGTKTLTSSLYLGSYVNKLPILARQYGAARQEHEDLLGRLIEDGRKSAKR